MKVLRQRVPGVATALGVICLAAAGSLHTQSQASDPAKTLAGAWTLNRDLSDQPQSRSRDGDQNGGRRREGGMGRGGGFGRRGGFGGGGFGGAGISPEDRQRVRDAMRDIMSSPDRLTITQADSMVIITAGDGRVTRLSPNGKKIKDESTKIERKTKWDGAKLVTEITGAGPRTITETYLIDPRA